MTILVCGSLAFDTIMDFEGRFADHILPDQLHILNVSFLVPGLRREFGGCAGNIAYGLRQLGAAVRPVATLGADGADYRERLRGLGVDVSAVRLCDDSYTAQAMIMTDRDNNQITAFHPGAMAQAHTNPIGDTAGVSLAILAPDGKQATWEHAQQLHAAGVPFVFDPGQGLPLFTAEELRQLVELADWAALNDYEARLLCDRTGWTLAELSRRVRALVVTLGEHGCEVWQDGAATRVPGVKATAVVDPTGCGDAFRAALL
ncbi:carbohydrate kinase family protein [Tepidimonas charontis]|uniref:Adenosine kinase n=1 Tax=Tepidimonas charontis TaxID=2267262 RepID=A0A554X2P5_9BURK|nr:carbohydrate kinase family protein [Tepidimonas charontis]TSE30112.1 Adenosine kinase [Tepidimonas charontis]